MSVQFKLREDLDEGRRREIVAALDRAGFAARTLFPGQKRSSLASIFTVGEAEAKDVGAVEKVLADFGDDVEYVEAAPDRRPKR
jgi:hypothetical protein